MILGTRRAVMVYAYPAPVDLRNGYNGLYGLVQNGLGRDPLGGELFLLGPVADPRQLEGLPAQPGPPVRDARARRGAQGSGPVP